MMRQYELVERVRAYNPDVDEDRLNRAYVFTVQMHGTQTRASGDPYFSHPVEVAGLMTDLRMDEDTIITALLHDTVEDTLTSIEDVEARFGPEVARLVDGVTKLSKIEAQTEDERAAENLRKFLLAISDDIRVLLVKLADRLHNMRTLHFIKSPEKRRRIAKETMDIYAPLAERIGMYEYMHEMQLLAFEQLEPEGYATITGRLAQIREQGDVRIEEISQKMADAMDRAGLKAKVYGREKHPYSIWKKMQERHVAFEQLTDINAFRVIVDDIESCYRALGVLHRRWQMVPGRFKDFISTPKRNGYRSLHTTVMFAQNMRVEIQIRSADMHQAAEYGLAAHWAYKQDDQPDGQAGWLRDLIEILETSHEPEELLENTRMAMYQDRIFAFTPKGALHQLPKGATPVDFAYAVHTDLGDRAVGAKINGRHVPLRTLLNNGDMVDILTSKAHVPDPAWLNFAVTGKARAAIRRHVRHRERDEMILLGKKIYEEVVERLPAKIGQKALAAAVERLQLKTADELMYAVGAGKISDRRLIVALVPGFDADAIESEWPSQERAISIRGLTPGVAYNLGECCHPIPGDRIVGLRLPDAPVEVHTIHCDKLVSGTDADWVDLSWGQGSDGGAARLRVIVHNRPGMLAEMAGIFGFHKANILNLRMTARDSAFHTFEVDLEVHDLHHLMRIISALRASDAVAQADRLFS
ncbi:RelA/SpoT family protein [Sphingorhabdus sp.]|jgi:guanosine-3',5'-bis(diphosphate) 3'-pyrophosphohydrolase|uniref:RelA/SpoT family protein n=1 Tax=Sphingorhabdus sp. TaxID=1902408 RepID=UPI003BAFD5FB|nr:bifunctional (p)ppGpp synthetase/guanosine-3',5'-bis(diphosphate) 3'-pyrophosphohydrolase [Sphingomonadales bacterium]MBK9432058.1 bifunctional (p)ppGpp synthetase/guanosine-3',5'-bis(diphosphate) 3'-pyrophosphohydrolase [Sphingomonadales bacterium]MBL0023415.1 bifunctional (p)ppGpp synthetase/guanosine-3',5'-bis(diphosphate) 3'-pyrophosphohydrolase [Sphingomonadales bacterium]